MESDLRSAVEAILALYDRVATGESQGSRGSFYANGKGTLCDVHVPVEMLERLASATGHTVHRRDSEYRKQLSGSA